MPIFNKNLTSLMDQEMGSRSTHSAGASPGGMRRELGRRPVPQCAVGPAAIVILSPYLPIRFFSRVDYMAGGISEASCPLEIEVFRKVK